MTGGPDLDNASYPDFAYYGVHGGSFPAPLDYENYTGEGEDVLLFDGIEALNIVRSLICAIGVTANTVAIFMILVLTDFRKSITSWYILQLALADTVFLLTLPFKIVEDSRNSWDFPEWMCQGNQSILFINYYCSVTFLTIMAIDRYIAICHSFSERLQKFRTHKAAYITTAMVWIIAILICVPIMLHSVVEGTKPNCRCSLDFTPVTEKNFTKMCLEEEFVVGDDGFEGCVNLLAQVWTDESCKTGPTLQMTVGGLSEYDDFPPLGAPPSETEGLLSPNAPPSETEGLLPPNAPPSESQDPLPFGSLTPNSEDYVNVACHHIGNGVGYHALIYFNFGVMFIVPFLIIFICYALIIRHLMKSPFKSSECRSTSRDDKNRNRVAIMCATLVGVFVACWLPYHAVNLAKMSGITGSNEFCSKLFHATSFLVYVNSAVNPFIYFIVARFRSSCKRFKKYRAASAVISLFTRNVERSGNIRSHSENTKNTRKSDADNVVTATTCVNGTSV